MEIVRNLENKKTIRKMFENIMHDLFKEIEILEEYKDCANRLEIAEKTLVDTMDEEQEEMLNEYLNIQFEEMMIQIEEAYVRGFSDANKLRDESLQ